MKVPPHDPRLRPAPRSGRLPTMRTCLLPRLLAILALAAALPSANAQLSKLTKEKGAVYVEDLTAEPVKLKLRESATIYSDVKAQRSIGVLTAGQTVPLVAFTENACRVRARATHGDVVGWVGMKFLEAQDPTLFDRLKQAADRQRQVQALIDKREVAIGMSPDEVIQSLGKPDEQTSDVQKDSSSESFSYITYNKVPQKNLMRDRFGRLYETVTYIKVETGRITVTFENGAVSGIQTTKGRPNWNNSRIVVPPINIW
jgi:hypothetical protein